MSPRVRRRAGTVVALLALFVPVCAGRSSAGSTREPVRIAREGGRLIVTPVPALREAIHRHFPGYDVPPLAAFAPDLRKLILLPRPPQGEPPVSSVCVGDFDGNGLPDVVLFLKNRHNQWLLAAFHQSYRGGFHPYRLARVEPLPDGTLACWILRHPPGTVRAYFSTAEDRFAVTGGRSKHDWIEMEDDAATYNFGYYFKRGRYRSVRLG